MDLQRRVPNTVNTEKSIRFEEIFCDQELSRFSRSIGSFDDDEGSWTFLSRKKYISFFLLSSELSLWSFCRRRFLSRGVHIGKNVVYLLIIKKTATESKKLVYFGWYF
jgi:hypothetical protein